jgi:hypothetical protein
LKILNFDIRNIDKWAVHPGGKRILDNIKKSLNLPYEALLPSYSILNNYGNMSSPTILFVLDYILNEKIHNNEKVIDEFKEISITFIVSTLLISGISLVMFLFKFNLTYKDTFFGYSDGMLNGLYTGSNGAGIIAFMSIVASIIYVYLTKKFRMLALVNILVELEVLILSKSRSALLSFLVFLIIFFYFITQITIMFKLF